MSKTSMNLQDSFLNQVRRENAEVKVLLVNGTTLRGTVKGFDNFTLILSSRNGQHLVYKHAIAQLLSHRSAPVRQEDGESVPQAEPTEETHEDTPATAAPPAAEHSPAPHRQKPSENSPGQRQQQNKPSANPSAGQQQHKQPREKRPPRKEGFNTLDLSLVKLEEGDKSSQA